MPESPESTDPKFCPTCGSRQPNPMCTDCGRPAAAKRGGIWGGIKHVFVTVFVAIGVFISAVIVGVASLFSSCR